MWSKTLRKYSFKSQFSNVWKLLPLYMQLIMWIVVAYNLCLVLLRALASFWGPSKLCKMRLVHLLLAHKLHHAVGLEGGSLSAICISFAIATPANGVAPNAGWSWITVHGWLLMLYLVKHHWKALPQPYNQLFHKKIIWMEAESEWNQE